MPSEPSGTQSIERAAQLLVRVVEAPRAPSIGELAEHEGLPKSTTSRLVSALERQGLIQRLGDRGRLRPGPVLIRFASRDGAATIVELAQPSLRRLAEASGETINLAVPGPGGVEHLAQEDTAHVVGVIDWVGRRVPFELAANGKCFLAFGGTGAGSTGGQAAGARRRNRLALGEQGELTDELRLVRTRGWATSVDELEDGLSAVAAPVLDGHGEAVAALSISGPSARLRAERIAGLVPLLVEECRELARRLGQPDHVRGAA